MSSCDYCEAGVFHKEYCPTGILVRLAGELSVKISEKDTRMESIGRTTRDLIEDVRDLVSEVEKLRASASEMRRTLDVFGRASKVVAVFDDWIGGDDA